MAMVRAGSGGGAGASSWRSRRRLRRALRAASFQEGPARLWEGGTEDRRAVLTVVAAGADERFVETTLGLSRQLGLTIEVVALVSPHPARSRQPTPDIVESMGAVSLARRFGELGGVQPEWDVLHGPTPERALVDYVERTRPRLVALPPGFCGN